VKNVHADAAVLEAMYGQNADRFFDLKLELDPTWTVQNEFLRRTFPGYPKAPPAPSTDPTVAAGRGPGPRPADEAPAREEEEPARRE
jgi:hypothetical protein